MSNLVRARNRLPFDFQDGLKVSGVELTTKINALIIESFNTGVADNLTPEQIIAGLGYTPVNKAGDAITGNISVTGDIVASGNVTAYSDEKLKKDWVDLPGNFVEKLAGVKSGTYTRIDTEERQVGVTAQSLKEILPEAVANHGGLLSVAYGNAAMVSVIELAKENLRYASLVQQLFCVIQSLNIRIEKLEQDYSNKK